jgi:Ran GTPase-activating protein (RanGAP) involved in mRNA processing and transport
MGAMTSLHVGMNAIPEKEMKEITVIAMSKDNMKLLCEVPIKDKTLTELDVSGKSLGTEGALVVAEYLRDNGAMTKFDISSNDLMAEGGKALAEGLKGNQVITKLNFSGNNLGYNSNGRTDTSGIVAIADIIPGMGAMTSLNLASNELGTEGAEIVAEAIKVTKCTPAIILVPFSSI